MNAFGDHIRQKRKELGLSTKDVAEVLGLSQPYISQLENGNRAQLNNIHTVAKLCNLLGITLDEGLKLLEGNKPMKSVMIDPGHGGNDSGATYEGYKEKDFTLKISLALRNYLKDNYSLNVWMTRDKDATLSLNDRTNMANVKGVDLFVSIHLNAGGGTGYEDYIYNGSVPSSTINKQDTIHKAVMNRISSYNVKDRGKKRADFAVLRQTKMEAVLLENLFIDTDKDLDLLIDNNFINDLVVGIGEGIAKALLL